MRGFRLWEYGVGDTVRQATFAALRRVEPGVFELEADIETVVALEGSALEVSLDRQIWKTLAAKSVGGKVEASVTLVDLGSGGRVFLRVR